MAIRLRYNVLRIERDYRASCRELGRRPNHKARAGLKRSRSLFVPGARPIRAAFGHVAALPPLPPDVFATLVDALADALVKDFTDGNRLVNRKPRPKADP